MRQHLPGHQRRVSPCFRRKIPSGSSPRRRASASTRPAPVQLLHPGDPQAGEPGLEAQRNEEQRAVDLCQSFDGGDVHVVGDRGLVTGLPERLAVVLYPWKVGRSGMEGCGPDAGDEKFRADPGGRRNVRRVRIPEPARGVVGRGAGLRATDSRAPRLDPHDENKGKDERRTRKRTQTHEPEVYPNHRRPARSSCRSHGHPFLRSSAGRPRSSCRARVQRLRVAWVRSWADTARKRTRQPPRTRGLAPPRTDGTSRRRSSSV